MQMQTIVSCILIFAGAVIMLYSIAKTKEPLKAIPSIPPKYQQSLKRYLDLHRVLMIFFFFGYLAVLIAIIFKYSPISELFVSVIFLLGAIFVFLGIVVQFQLLLKVQLLLQGILPICTKCKKIRVQDGSPDDPNAWETVENYLVKRADVNFSHGYCSDCYQMEVKKLEQFKRKRR